MQESKLGGSLIILQVPAVRLCMLEREGAAD